MRTKMYRKGGLIRTMGALDRELVAGNYLWWFHCRTGGRPKHPGFVCSMQYRALQKMVKGKMFYRAVRVAPKEKA